MHYNLLKYLQVFISKHFVDETAFVLLKMCIELQLSAENLIGGAERQRCCSSWDNGEEAGWVGVTLIVLTHA